ncbi:uncharacterized protein LOC135955160 [Calliphora vicina]|uniref:uncharacterized protein LOC135955160 n=1 Tax=Calliphora vicina TaxID=7373 RepID=UPI00325B4BEB
MRLELRIQEAKQKGSYNPNNDYSSYWAYFGHMDFMKDNTNNSIKLLNRNSADKFKLIAEVRKRPELWCIKSKEYMPRSTLQTIWEDLAQAMGAEVDECKLKWTRLLKGYRVEVKKLELRINEDKLNGSYNPKKEYRSKWIFYERMKFCDDFKNPSLMELENTFVNVNHSDDNDANQVSKFQNNKMKPELDLEPEVYLPDDEDSSPETPVGVKSNFSGLNLPENQEPADDKPTTSHWKSANGEPGLDLEPEVYIPDDEDYDTDSQMSDIEFISEQNSPSNQESANDKPLSTGVLTANAEPELDLDPEVYIIDDEDYDTDSQMSGIEFLSEPNSPQNQESANDKPSSTGILLEDIEKEQHNLTKSAKVYALDDEDEDTDSQMSGIEFLSGQNSPLNQKSADDIPSSTGGNCTKRSYDQANSLEDLEKDEHNSIKTARSNDMVPVTDDDYSFLVSYLPKMKKFNELQNLEFRAKITDLMLDIEKE